MFLIPGIIEFAQHVTEIKLGMYHSLAAFEALSEAHERLGMGLLKVASLGLPGWWFIRYLGFGENAQAARTIDPHAFKLWLVIFVLGIFAAALGLLGPSPGAMLGLSHKAGQMLSVASGIAEFVVEVYLTAWVVAWPLGNAAIGPLRSIRLMSGHFWRATGYYVAGFLPLMIVHYALGMGAIGRPEPWVWVMMGLDALVVAALALTMTGGVWLGAQHAARVKGQSLTP